MTSNSQCGKLLVTKLNNRGGKSDGDVAGYHIIRPNRADPYSSELSPMKLGPVITGETKFPKASNIENFWQFSKCFERDLEVDGTIGANYEASKLKGYKDVIPHRHKYQRGMKPLYTVFYDGETAKQYAYVESRKFYCNHYAALALKCSKYQKLVDMLLEGKNVQLQGYDGYWMCSHDYSLEDLAKAIKAAYHNPSRPFGHELVLFTMLCKSVGWIDKFPWPVMPEVSSRYM